MAQEKATPAKENSGYLDIRAIYLHSSKGDTESTEFEMQEEQNASTRIRQSLPRGSGNHLFAPWRQKRSPDYGAVVLIDDQRRIHWLSSGVAL